MTSKALSKRVIAVEHVTIASEHPFEIVRDRLETCLPRIDSDIFTLLERGEWEAALQKMEAAAPLSIFGQRDHGALLAIVGSARNAIQYDIGNPLTASRMTRNRLSAALYAPIRVLLREDGDVAFEYDRPVSVFGQFGDDDIDRVACQLDYDLRSALEAVAT